ncbi:MAG: SPASM domain-containing protein [Deltaproteobacteria bacterium]|nr:SPASM domain-containing protein [Deltaproteobacteria bacterium]
MQKRLTQFQFEKQSLLLPTVCKTPPLHIQIEPTNICNLKCPLCVTHQIAQGQKAHLTLEKFRFLIDKFDSHLRIYLTKFGEPFSNPDIFKMIQYAKQRGHHICLSSNFDIDPSLIPEIIASAPDELIISLDGFSQQTNNTYRIGSNFENIVQNMLTLHHKKKERNAAAPKITWQYLVNRFNEHEMAQAKEFAKKYGINIVFDSFGLGEDMPEFDFGDMERLKARWLPQDTKHTRPFFKGEINQRLANTVCLFLWRSMSINADLKVTPCCHTYTKESFMGDLAENSVMEIWNNEKYQSARRLFNHKVCADKGVRTICHACPNFSKRKTKAQHLRDQVSFLYAGILKRLRG